MDEPELDCLVIGGGPAGLTAAIYLARFHLELKVVDAGNSRAALIPCTRNHAGFPEGISGDRADRPDEGAGAEISARRSRASRVTRLDRDRRRLSRDWGSGSATARTVLLATGIENRRPPMDERLHDEALARGLIRYCPICDGYEVTDKKLGVIGSGAHGVAEAVFLRAYTADITLIAPDRAHDLARRRPGAGSRALGIRTVDGPCHAVAALDEAIVVETPHGHHTFDSVYPALGSDVHTELAGQIGVALNEETGCILVDAHQRTSVPGAYAAGDVVLGLDQISHAMGEGGVAATTIRNDLARERPFRR